jgi:hypothetical protein
MGVLDGEPYFTEVEEGKKIMTFNSCMIKEDFKGHLFDYRPEGGETINEVIIRANQFFNKIEEDLKKI